MRILYLDDEKDLTELFKDLLERDGFEILCFNDTHKAIEATIDREPDVIFIDLILSHGRGDNAALKMPRHIPKYLVTGEADVESRYPFDGVIEKPVNYYKIKALLTDLQKKSL